MPERQVETDRTIIALTARDTTGMKRADLAWDFRHGRAVFSV
jgi:hypothetical protein